MYYGSLAFPSPCFTGNRTAAAAAMITVSRIVRIPSDMFDTPGRYAAAKLAPKHTIMIPAIRLFFLAGGMITARNIPYRATLNALTSRKGRILPAIVPSAVPSAQQGAADKTAP